MDDRWVNHLFEGVCKAPFPTTPAQIHTCVSKLEEIFHFQFQSLKSKIQAEPSRIVSSMQRTLPTTACILLAYEQENTVDVLSIWAGDSRGYVLMKEGLVQITEDNLTKVTNALENLYQDAPLSNVISAEGDYELHIHHLSVTKPCGLFFCTDGLFA